MTDSGAYALMPCEHQVGPGCVTCWHNDAVAVPMTIERALADACRVLCGPWANQNRHDDACTVLRRWHQAESAGGTSKTATA